MWKEFKQFAFKGNMIDLAVGVIIGGAFGKVITSIVNDLIMGPIGGLLGKLDFKNWFIPLDGSPLDGSKYNFSLDLAKADKVPTLNYGQFLSTMIDFLIVAGVIFIVIKQLSRFKKSEAPADPTTKECPHCLSEVPIKATRCKFCTSHLEEATELPSTVLRTDAPN